MIIFYGGDESEGKIEKYCCKQPAICILVFWREQIRTKYFSFEASPPNNERGYFWAFYKVSSLKDNAEIVIELSQPKFIAEIILYLISRKDDVFAKKNQSKVSDGIALLRQMGYTNFNPIWIDEE